jgi:hypothetical protein
MIAARSIITLVRRIARELDYQTAHLLVSFGEPTFEAQKYR